MEFYESGDPRLVENLRRDGVAFVANLLTKHEVAEVLQALVKYENEVLPLVPPAYHHHYRDGTLRSMLDMDQYDPWFHELAVRMSQVIVNLVDWVPVVQYVESFPKPPGSGAVGAHQELQTNPVEPPNFVHLWVALADAAPDNGGMSFYRGTHRLGMAPHEQPDEHVGAPTVAGQLLARMETFRIQPNFPAGSAAVFDCLTIHSSEANRSEDARPALTIAYRDAQAVLPDECANIESIIWRQLRQHHLTRVTERSPASSTGEEDLLALGADMETAAALRSFLVLEYGVDLAPAATLLHSTPRALAASTAAARNDNVAVVSASASTR